MRHKRTLFCILFIFLYSVSISLAVPPTTKYQPGATLDPLCAPGDTNCSIQVLPDQTSNANTFLTTDGSSSAWSAQTFVLGGNFATTGAYTMTLTATGTTALTLPTSGTLATTANINTAVSGTTNYIPKFTGTNTIGNSLIYDDGTNIGINDTSPSSRLTVGGDIRIKAGSGGAIIFADGTSINTSSIPGSAGSLANTSDAIITGDSDANATGDVILKTASNDRLHILNSGNIGINTATPSALFSVGTASPFTVTNLGAVSALSYAGAGTGLTGTASSLTAGNVTTNANLTGHITSTGNATSLGSFTSANLSTALSDETGTGLVVFATSPTLTTPNIGAATGSSLNLSSGAITSGLINGQTISSAASFTGSVGADNISIGSSASSAIVMPLGGAGTPKGRLAGYDLTNQIGFTNNYTLSDGQDDATKPSLGFYINTTLDKFTFSRKAAGSVGTLANLVTIDNAGGITGGAASFTTGAFSGNVNYAYSVGTLRTLWAGGYGGAIQLVADNATSARYSRIGIVDSTGTWAGGMTINNDQSATFANTVNAQLFNAVRNDGGIGIGVTNGIDADLQITTTIGGAVTKYASIAPSSAVNLVLNQNGGNVGIGTTGPGLNLSVQGPFGLPTTSGIQTAGIFRVQDSVSNIALDMGTIQNAGTWIQSGNKVNSSVLTLALNPNGGNVGIGTTSPAYPLDVVNQMRIGAQGGVDVLLLQGGSGYGSVMKMYYANGAIGTQIAGNQDSYLNTVTGNVGIGTTGPGEKLEVAGNIKLTSAGSIFLGQSAIGLSDSNSASLGYNGIIHLNRLLGSGLIHMVFGNGGTQVGTITSTTTATSYNTSSDSRLKENIVTTARGLDSLMEIQVADFNFIADPHRTLVQGFIAQNLYDVYPEAVTVGGEDPNKNPWQVDYGRLSPLIVQAIQELDIKVQSLPEFEDETLAAKVADFLRGIAERGEAMVDLVTTKKVQTDELCVKKSDGTNICVTGDQLNTLLNSSGIDSSSSGDSSTLGPTLTTDPTPPDEPGAEDTTLPPQDVPTPSDASDSGTVPPSDPTPTPPTGSQ